MSPLVLAPLVLLYLELQPVLGRNDRTQVICGTWAGICLKPVLLTSRQRPQASLVLIKHGIAMVTCQLLHMCSLNFPEVNGVTIDLRVTGADRRGLPPLGRWGSQFGKCIT